MKKWSWFLRGYIFLVSFAVTSGQASGLPMDSREQTQLSMQATSSAKEFKLMLHEVPGSSEWVRVEKKENTYRVVHSCNGLQSSGGKPAIIAFSTGIKCNYK